MLYRLLNMKNIELYEVKESLCDDVKYYMLLLDHRRPSKFEDYAFIPNMPEEDFESRGNFMQAFILHEGNLSDEEKEEAYEQASGFLENKDNCSWNMDYVEVEFKDYYSIDDLSKDMLEPLNRMLEKVGYEERVTSINTESFAHLYQE